MMHRRTLLSILLMLFVTVVRAQEEAPTEATPTEEPPAEDAPGQEVPADEGDAGVPLNSTQCRPCPVITIQHYEAKGCTPVIDDTIDSCCPTSFSCKREEDRGISQSSCLYKEVAYEVGQPVPVDGPCRTSCVCKKSIDDSEPAKIQCSIVECPSLFSPTQPGCRSLYSIDECCEVDRECHDVVSPSEVGPPEANGTFRSADCFSEGLEYYLGDKVLFSAAPCQYCVCTPEFSGPFGPGCTKLDCGIEYRNRVQLREGCTPLYLSGACCNADWICPGSPQIISDPDLKPTEEETPSTHCTFGNTTGPVGTALTTYDCHVSCTCVVPPEFTCVRYPTCELALQARRSGFAP